MLDNKSKTKNRIAELRKEKGLSLQEVGNAIGVGNNTISRYENNKREPKLEVWQKLANYFHVPVNYLQGLTISKEQALDTLVGWLNNSYGYLEFDMHRILIDHLKFYGVKEATIKRAMHDKQLAEKLILEYVPLITRVPFLSKFDENSLTNGDFENEIAIRIGSGAEQASAELKKIKFTDNEEKNSEIQEQLDNIFQDIYMRIDELSESVQKSKKHPSN